MHKNGFSLLELLVVLAVMGVMMGVLGFTFLSDSSSHLGDAQRSLISYLQKTKAVAVARGVETRIIVPAESDDSEKLLRHAQIISFDKNQTGQWLIEDNGLSLPKDVWFVSDNLGSRNPDWPWDGVCVWSSSDQEEEFRLKLVKSRDGKQKVFEETAEGDHFLFLKCMPNGNFNSSLYPKMPKLVFAKGKLFPSESGVITPSFTNLSQIAGLQIQPYGGILSLGYQDFSNE